MNTLGESLYHHVNEFKRGRENIVVELRFWAPNNSYYCKIIDEDINDTVE